MTTHKDTTRTAIQLTVEKRAALRESYPGPRGGVDWRAVVAAALNNEQPASKHP